MNVCAIIPVKPFSEGKARLAPVLSPKSRAALCRRLFEHVLDVACATKNLEEILVVSADETARVIAEGRGASALPQPAPEPGPAGLNAALALGCEQALAHLFATILVLPADLAFVTTAEIDAMIATGAGRGPAMVIAADEAGDGTNALLLSPPDLIGFSFGAASFDNHLKAARTKMVDPVIIERPGLAFDVDAPEDLSRIAHRFPLF